MKTHTCKAKCAHLWLKKGIHQHNSLDYKPFLTVRRASSAATVIFLLSKRMAGANTFSLIVMFSLTSGGI